MDEELDLPELKNKVGSGITTINTTDNLSIQDNIVKHVSTVLADEALEKEKLDAYNRVQRRSGFTTIEQGIKSANANLEPTEVDGVLAAATRQYTLLEGFGNMIKENTFKYDSSFNALNEPDFDKLSTNHAVALATTRSKEHYDWTAKQIEQAEADNILIQSSGMTGIAANMLVSVLDPTSLASGFFTAGLSWVQKGTRLARAVKTGLVTGTEAALLESAVVASHQAKDSDDVMYAFIGGTALGGGFGAFTKGMDETLGKMKTKLDEEMIAKAKQGGVEEDVLNPEDIETFGHTKTQDEIDLELNTEPNIKTDTKIDTKTDTEDILDSTTKTDEDPLKPDLTFTGGKAEDIIKNAEKIHDDMDLDNLSKFDTFLSYIDHSDANILLKHPSKAVRAWFANLVEHGSGLRSTKKTAVGIANHIEEQMLSPTGVVRDVHYPNWARSKGITSYQKIADPTVLQDFHLEVMKEATHRRNLARGGMSNSDILKLRRTQQVDSISDAADAIQKSYDIGIDAMKKNGVAGFEEIDNVIGYFPLIWKYDKMAKRIQKLGGGSKGTKKLMHAITKSYVKVGIPDDIASKIADAVFTRVKNNELSIDMNPSNLFDIDSRSVLRNMLEGEDVADDSIERLFRLIDGNLKNKGKAKFAKSRVDIDLLEVDEYGTSMFDLIDTDLSTMTTRYAREASGRSGLARYGLKSDADVKALKNALLDDALESGNPLTPTQVSAMNALTDQLSGKAVAGGLAPWVRRTKQFLNLSSLGTTGWISQMSEYHTFIGKYGISKTIDHIKELKTFIRDVETGEVSNSVIRDLETFYGVRLGSEHKLHRVDVYLDDNIHPTTSKVDYALGQASHVLGYMNGMNTIKQFQDIGAVNTQIQVLADFAKKHTTGKHITDAQYKRLDGIGLNKQDSDKIFKNINDYADIDKDGMLTNLNLAKWKDEDLLETLIVSLNKNTNQLFQRAMTGEDFFWASSSTGALVTQFMRYPMVAIGKQMGRNLKFSDMESATTLMYSMALASAFTALKIHIDATGRSDRKKYLKKRFETEAFTSSAMNLMSPLSILPTVSSALVSTLGGGNAYGNRVGGVPIQTLGENVMALTNLPANLMQGDLSQADINKVTRMLPFANTIGIKQVLNGLTK